MLLLKFLWRKRDFCILKGKKRDKFAKTGHSQWLAAKRVNYRLVLLQWFHREMVTGKRTIGDNPSLNVVQKGKMKKRNERAIDRMMSKEARPHANTEAPTSYFTKKKNESWIFWFAFRQKFKFSLKRGAFYKNGDIVNVVVLCAFRKRRHLVLVSFPVLIQIKPQAPPLVCPSVNSFKFQPFGRSSPRAQELWFL